MYQDKGCPGVDSIHDCCIENDLRVARAACDELRARLAIRGRVPAIVAIKDGTAKVYVEGGEWCDDPSFRAEFADADQVHVITRWEWHP